MFRLSPRHCLLVIALFAVTVAGCPPSTSTSTVPNLVGMTQSTAESAITDAGLSVGTVTEQFSDTVSAGQVISQNPAAGATVDSGATVTLVVSLGTLKVQGRVLFDDGSPVEGAQITGSIPPEDAAALAQLALQKEAALTDWTRPEFKANPPQAPYSPSRLLRTIQSTKQLTTMTDADGNFTFELVPETLLPKVLVEVRYDATPLPVVDTAKYGTAESSTLDIGTVMIPNPTGTEVSISEGAGQNSDASVQVEGLPTEVKTLFASGYDPDASPEVFPGEFAEMGTIPLNSSGFVWIEGLDADGKPVTDLSQATTIRSQISRSQWVDLEDISDGTDRIEIPIYTYNEDLNMWEQQANGWLEDGDRTVLPEDAQSVILDGTFDGELFATFTTDHFSWMNVDYAFIGPWTLSRLDRSRRNTDCLFNALQLAKTIAKSAKGHTAYARVNLPGANLDTELGDGKGPELKDSDLSGAYGVYKGDSGGSETQFEIDTDLWNGCGEGATEDEKKNTTLIMAITILHETAHWKDDVKKNPDDDTDTPGEEGNQLEKDLFGGIITGGSGGLKRDGVAVSTATRDSWLSSANWPAAASGSKAYQSVAVSKQDASLAVSIAVSKDTFELGEEIPVEVTYTNISSAPIDVLNTVVLEGWPLYFNIVLQGSESRALFLGPESKLLLTDDSFDALGSGETLVQTVNLLRDPVSSALRYQFINSGTYDISAVYESFRGVPEAESNTITLNVLPGGSLSGNLTDATTGQPLSGSTVKVMQNDSVLTSATSDGSGDYSIPELPAGTYTLEVHASGFLRNSQENVQVTAGENTVVNFSLSPLLAQGELRLVLTWGEQPNDLDSHLWLPMETPYHVYYNRRGSLDGCPFALLDVDDTNSFGPETITISDRFSEGTYVYSIHNYSGSPSLIESMAQVEVFDSTGLIATFDVPIVGEGRFWNVLSIDGATGAITEIGTLGDTPEPYTDTGQGCAR